MHAPRRAAVAAAFLLSISSPATAALHIDAPATYSPGDVLTITVTGDSEGAKAGIVRAVMTVDPALLLVIGVAGVLQDSSPPFLWQQTGEVGTCGHGSLAENQCTAADAYSYLIPEGPAIDVLPSTLSAWQLDTSDATGDLLFHVQGDGAGFFGFQADRTVALVPEPATALLLASGLAALAARGRTRRRR